jgi:Rhodopirellula transposase DDE domain
MDDADIRFCGCARCQQEVDHPDRDYHRALNLLMRQLRPPQRRLFAAIESRRIGKGGRRLMAEITGICLPTIRRGRVELTALLEGTPLEGAKGRPGRHSIRETYPDIEAVLEEVLADDVAGDPMTRKKWVRISSRNLSKKLAQKGYTVSYHTVCGLLTQMGYSLKVNVKTRASTMHSPQRDKQFKYIAAQKAAFLQAGNPVISVDAKKKELIGDFKANGRVWCKKPIEVADYEFPSMAEYVATPYGVYDLGTNKGYVYIGTTGNTPAFAIASIKLWWQCAGRHVYEGPANLLILADSGGSNGCRSRAWKYELQKELCDGLGMTVTVCHYPTRCSKHNPIERRLFSHISMNWAGKPLSSLELMLAYIRGTTTETGLSVEAFLKEGAFSQGQKVSKTDMERLALKPHSTCHIWNYTMTPRQNDDGNR